MFSNFHNLRRGIAGRALAFLLALALLLGSSGPLGELFSETVMAASTVFNIVSVKYSVNQATTATPINEWYPTDYSEAYLRPQPFNPVHPVHGYSRMDLNDNPVLEVTLSNNTAIRHIFAKVTDYSGRGESLLEFRGFNTTMGQTTYYVNLTKIPGLKPGLVKLYFVQSECEPNIESIISFNSYQDTGMFWVTDRTNPNPLQMYGLDFAPDYSSVVVRGAGLDLAPQYYAVALKADGTHDSSFATFLDTSWMNGDTGLDQFNASYNSDGTVTLEMDEWGIFWSLFAECGVSAFRLEAYVSPAINNFKVGGGELPSIPFNPYIPREKEILIAPGSATKVTVDNICSDDLDGLRLEIVGERQSEYYDIGLGDVEPVDALAFGFAIEVDLSNYTYDLIPGKAHFVFTGKNGKTAHSQEFDIFHLAGSTGSRRVTPENLYINKNPNCVVNIDEMTKAQIKQLFYMVGEQSFSVPLGKVTDRANGSVDVDLKDILAKPNTEGLSYFRIQYVSIDPNDPNNTAYNPNKVKELYTNNFYTFAFDPSDNGVKAVTQSGKTGLVIMDENASVVLDGIKPAHINTLELFIGGKYYPIAQNRLTLKGSDKTVVNLVDLPAGVEGLASFRIKAGNLNLGTDDFTIYGFDPTKRTVTVSPGTVNLDDSSVTARLSGLTKEQITSLTFHIEDAQYGEYSVTVDSTRISAAGVNSVSVNLKDLVFMREGPAYFTAVTKAGDLKTATFTVRQENPLTVLDNPRTRQSVVYLRDVDSGYALKKPAEPEINIKGIHKDLIGTAWLVYPDGELFIPSELIEQVTGSDSTREVKIDLSKIPGIDTKYDMYGNASSYNCIKIAGKMVNGVGRYYYTNNFTVIWDTSVRAFFENSIYKKDGSPINFIAYNTHKVSYIRLVDESGRIRINSDFKWAGGAPHGERARTAPDSRSRRNTWAILINSPTDCTIWNCAAVITEKHSSTVRR